MGLCIKCRGKEAVNKDRKCRDCSSEYYRRFYERRKTLGLCIKCHQKNDNSNLLCMECARKAKVAQNDRRVRAKNNFRCVVCNKSTDGQHTECDGCRRKRNDQFVLDSERRYSDGLCGQCGKNVPKEGLHTCGQCLEKARLHYHTKDRQKRIDENRRVKLLIFNHYGNQCSCCGEAHTLLLNVDHVNNDGKKHRQIRGTSKRIYQDIVDQGFPDLYQLLCWNCNMGKYLNGGICPHER